MLVALIIWLLLPIWVCADIAKWIVKKYGYVLYDESYVAKYKDSFFDYNSLITINVFWLLYPIAYFITKYTSSWIWDGQQPITFRGITLAFIFMFLFYWRTISPLGIKFTLLKFILVRLREFIDNPENFSNNLNDQDEYYDDNNEEDMNIENDEYDLLDDLIDINYRYKSSEINIDTLISFLYDNLNDLYTYVDTDNEYENDIVKKIIKLILLYKNNKINNTQLTTYLNKLCEQLSD